MENLKSYYHKAKIFCKKQIDKDPYLAKSVLIHVSVVVLLCILSFVSTLRFSSPTNFEVQIKGKPNHPTVIQATSITSQDLDKQIQSYENNREQERKARQDIKDAKQDIKEARAKAIKQAKARAKAKAEADRKAKLEEQMKAKLEARRKEQKKQQELENQRKIAEKQKQQKLEEQRKKELQNKKAKQEKAKLEAEKKRKQQEAEKQRRAREARLAKARAEAQESARRQVQKSQSDSAIASYLGEYQQRIEDHWVRDNCRGIYKFPKAIARNGRFIKLTGTTGNFRCDQSLIDAIKDTTPPAITNDVAKQRLQDENISFLFDPYK